LENFDGPIFSHLLRAKTPKTKKGLYEQAFYKLRAFLHWCGKKAFEEKPIISRWVTVACVRKSYRVGISDPSRPDFPELGLSVFSNSAFYTNTAGVSLQYFLYHIQGPKSIEYRQIQGS